ncbi:MAG: VOC family protein [Betaproteobacteria bacterium]|jgi:hypothetical protein|nr:VOC family protein [Betaproteobacteria bacterium]
MTTTAAIALDLDHCGTIVRDLDRAQQVFARLGFNLTTRSHHVGSPTPGAPIEPLGSANHCAMLQQGYLEVMGHVDPTKTSNAVAMAKRYEGLHIVAFRPESSELVQSRLIDRGLPVDPVRALERMTPYGPEGRESRRVAFKNSRFNTGVFTEAQFQYTEHLTRDVMWQKHLTVHPNGALALQALYLCSPDPQATAAKFVPLLGIAPVANAQGEQVFEFAASRLVVLSPAAWALRAPGEPTPPLPAPVGFDVRVDSLAKARACLEANGVPVQPGTGAAAGGLRVGTAHACGVVIHFREGM